ncbi:hypothetical protein A8F94_03515 [Bacillus sp. FJAT-27225]|uniref:DUF5359 family protein n=1 Tax=Bacillus sp. FJAT-27225 TaxID=1743144 RepID=UPI00080C2DA5|nr:DUF5359 family protein [Bacillus sp. FJAT-27225]OCA90950.1 hypothetical protein A8F94_03515 [Bacillus sp. FJAT-27225]
MKRIERIMIKIAVAQLLFLILAQLIFHQFGLLQEVLPITKYEGGKSESYTDFLESFQDK